MRSVLAAGVLAAFATAAVANDMVVRQRSETSIGGSGTREETVYLSNDFVVTDSSLTRTIVDLGNKTILAADKTKRIYTVVTFDEITAQMEAFRKQLAELPPDVRSQMGPLLDEGPPVTVTPTGKTDTIAGYEAAEWALKGGPYSGSVWATESVPTPTAFQKWKAIEQGEGGAPGVGRQLGLAMQKVKGFPLRTRIETRMSGRTVVLSNEVISVKDAPTPPEMRTVPSGYTKQTPGP
jgi:uncharacterized protein DUF4412